MKTMFEFMKDREKSIDDGFFDPYDSRRFDKTEVRQVATRAQQRDRSDPFAYARAMTRMRKGIYSPKDLLNNALSV